MDAAVVINDWKNAAEVHFVRTRAEAFGRPVAETNIPPQFREAHGRGLQHFLTTGEGPLLNRRIEVAALHRDGHEFPVEMTITPIRWGQTYLFGAFVRDITQRRRAEEAPAPPHNLLR